MFKSIEKESVAEIVEKKSKFIANVFYVENIEEAEEKIKEIKKRYYDARHNCYAYSITTKEGRIERFSDDGEPSGTAGSPMINIINGNNLSNILVVVTRYFGGILLGTGGLVRAYSEAFQKALDNSKIIEKELGIIAKLVVNYSELEHLKYNLKKDNIKIINTEFNENANVFIEITKEKYNLIEEKVESNTSIVLSCCIIEEAYIEFKQS